MDLVSLLKSADKEVKHYRSLYENLSQHDLEVSNTYVVTKRVNGLLVKKGQDVEAGKDVNWEEGDVGFYVGRDKDNSNVIVMQGVDDKVGEHTHFDISDLSSFDGDEDPHFFNQRKKYGF